MVCFECGLPTPSRKIACFHCEWDNENYIEKDDPRRVIFEALVERFYSKLRSFKDQDEVDESFGDFWDNDGFYLEATERELEFFEGGDHCRLNDVSWKIVSKDLNAKQITIEGRKYIINRYRTTSGARVCCLDIDAKVAENQLYNKKRYKEAISQTSNPYDFMTDEEWEEDKRIAAMDEEQFWQQKLAEAEAHYKSKGF